LSSNLSRYKDKNTQDSNLACCFVWVGKLVSKLRENHRLCVFREHWVEECMRASHMKTLSMFYLVIYCTQKVHNDFIFLCSIVLPPFGHSSNHEYHCWKLQDYRAVVRNFIALLRFSFDFPSYLDQSGEIAKRVENIA